MWLSFDTENWKFYFMETEAYLYNGRDKWGKFIPILSNDCFFSPLTIFFLFFNNRNSRILGGHMVYQKVSFPILPSSLETNVGIWLIFDQGRRKKNMWNFQEVSLDKRFVLFFFFPLFSWKEGMMVGRRDIFFHKMET